MNGEEVEGWVQDMGVVLDAVNPTRDNVPLLWIQFLQEFRSQYSDSQAAYKASIKLENLRMQGTNINQYVSDFEGLCHKADYQSDQPRTIFMFLKGLSAEILKDTIK